MRRRIANYSSIEKFDEIIAFLESEVNTGVRTTEQAISRLVATGCDRSCERSQVVSRLPPIARSLDLLQSLVIERPRVRPSVPSIVR